MCAYTLYPPIITVGHPAAIVPPCAVLSPIRAAGLPPIITVDEPFIIVSGGPTQTHMSPTTAAGIFPIKTFGTLGPTIGMRYRRGKRRGLHGAGVHISYSCCWRHNFQIKSYKLKIHFLIVH